jgi:hypothetical protein
MQALSPQSINPHGGEFQAHWRQRTAPPFTGLLDARAFPQHGDFPSAPRFSIRTPIFHPHPDFPSARCFEPMQDKVLDGVALASAEGQAVRLRRAVIAVTLLPLAARQPMFRPTPWRAWLGR